MFDFVFEFELECEFVFVFEGELFQFQFQFHLFGVICCNCGSVVLLPHCDVIKRGCWVSLCI